MFDDLVRDLDAHVLDAFGIPCIFIDPATGATADGAVVIDRDVQVLSDDGYTTLRQTHASFTRTAIEPAGGIELQTATERFRLSSPLADDGSLLVWRVVRISANDALETQDAVQTLASTINGEW